MTQQKQQPVAVPFSETLDVTDKGGGIPNGRYDLKLVRVEMFQGNKFGTGVNNVPAVPQDKLRFVLQVMSGPEQGNEYCQIENLPDVVNGKRQRLGRKHGCGVVAGVLLGRELKEGEPFTPSQLIRISGTGKISNGRLFSFMPHVPQQAAVQRQVASQPQAVAQPQQQHWPSA